MKKLLKDLPLSTKFFESLPKIDAPQSAVPPVRIFLITALVVSLFLVTCFWIGEYSSHKISRLTLVDYEENLSKTSKELNFVKRKNGELEKTLLDTEARLEQVIQSKQALQASHQTLEANFQNLKQRFLQMWERSQYEADPNVDFQNEDFQEARILDSAEIPQPATPSVLKNKTIEGAVIKVNPVYRFAIVNVGREQGIREGDFLYIFRDELPLDGKLRVDRLYDTIAACSIFLDDPSVTLRPGDAVLRR